MPETSLQRIGFQSIASFDLETPGIQLGAGGLRTPTMSTADVEPRGWMHKMPSGIHGMIVSLVASGFILVYFKEIIIPFVLAIFFVYLLR